MRARGMRHVATNGHRLGSRGARPRALAAPARTTARAPLHKVGDDAPQTHLRLPTDGITPQHAKTQAAVAGTFH